MNREPGLHAVAVAVALALALPACAADAALDQTYAAASAPLTLMTFNLAFWEHSLDHDAAAHRAAAIAGAESADLLVTQETSPWMDYLLRGDLPAIDPGFVSDYGAAPNIPFGQTLASRPPIGMIHHDDLYDTMPDGSGEYSLVQTAELEVTVGDDQGRDDWRGAGTVVPVSVMNAHLRTPHAEYRFDQPTLSGAALVAALAARGRPDVILGDFNLYAGDASYRALLAAGYADACQEPAPTVIPSSLPGHPVGSCRWTFGPDGTDAYDFILYRTAGPVTCGEAHSSQATRGPDGAFASDHFPLIASCTVQAPLAREAAATLAASCDDGCYLAGAGDRADSIASGRCAVAGSYHWGTEASQATCWRCGEPTASGGRHEAGWYGGAVTNACDDTLEY